MSGDGPSGYAANLPYDEDLLITEWLDGRKTEDAKLLARVADQFEQVGDALEQREDLPGALRNFDRTHEIRAQLARGDAPSPERKRDLSISLTRRARVYRKLGDLPSAAWNLQSAIKVRSWLVEHYPNDRAYASELRRAKDALHEVEIERAKSNRRYSLPRVSDERFESAVYERKPVPVPRDERARRADADGGDASSRRRDRAREPSPKQSGRDQRERAVMRRSARPAHGVGILPASHYASPEHAQRMELLVALATRAAKLSADSPPQAHELHWLSLTLCQMAAQLKGQGALTAALLCVDQARSIATRLVEAAPNNSKRILVLASARRLLGQVHERRGLLAAAEKHIDQSRQMAERLVRAGDGLASQLELCRSLEALASIRVQQGAREQACLLLDASQDMRENLVRTHPKLPLFLLLPKFTAEPFERRFDMRERPSGPQA